jgi:hypothetical protein
MKTEVSDVMMVGNAAGSITSLNLAWLSRAGGRMSVPVRPAQTVYAQYKHISGVPAAPDQTAVPLSRIRILDSLIENLNRMKNSPVAEASPNATPEQTDALIRRYAAELHQAVVSAPESFGTLAGAASSGMVLRLSA